MDPNMFHLGWERVFEVLVTIVIISFILERGLALVFESRQFIRLNEDVKLRIGRGLKEPIAFTIAVLVCVYWEFDAVSMILLRESTTLAGAIITGGIIAGGSKAAVKLFRDTLGFRSLAEEDRQALRKSQRVDTTTRVSEGGPQR
jgi:hypothetical protein